MKESFGEFRKKAQSGRIKSIHEDYYRFFSAYISWFFARFTSLTGNQITFIWVIVGLLCVVFYTLGSYKFTLIAAGLYFIRHTLDRVDGEVARYRNQQSIKGKLYDLFGHWVYEPLIFIAVSIGIYRTTNNFWILILGLFALYGYYLCDLVNISLILHKPGSKETIEKHNVNSEFISSFSFKVRVYRFIRFITFVDYFHVILLLASVLNLLLLFLIFSVIGWNFLWIVKVLSEIYMGGDY